MATQEQLQAAAEEIRRSAQWVVDELRDGGVADDAINELELDLIRLIGVLDLD